MSRTPDPSTPFADGLRSRGRVLGDELEKVRPALDSLTARLRELGSGLTPEDPVAPGSHAWPRGR